MSSHLRISVQSPASPAAIAIVDEGLDQYNIAGAPLTDVRPLHVIAEDWNGLVVGGAIGRTWGECCELQQLWVSPRERTNGIGSRLMDAFEKVAQDRGCLLVYLDTFSFQAPVFYGARGYTEVLRTTGFTGGVAKITMHKSLHAERAEA
jgi:GNAT superfamily N-acetyltransferase